MAKIIIKNIFGKNGLKTYNTVHYKSPLESNGNYLNKKALCGADYKGAIETDKKVDCPKCIKIVKYCKKIGE